MISECLGCIISRKQADLMVTSVSRPSLPTSTAFSNDMSVFSGASCRGGRTRPLSIHGARRCDSGSCGQCVQGGLHSHQKIATERREGHDLSDLATFFADFKQRQILHPKTVEVLIAACLTIGAPLWPMRAGGGPRVPFSWKQGE